MTFDKSTNRVKKRKKEKEPHSTFHVSLSKTIKNSLQPSPLYAPAPNERDNSLKDGEGGQFTHLTHIRPASTWASWVNYSSSHRDVKSRPSRTRFGFQKAHPQRVGTYLGVKDPSEIWFLKVPTSQRHFYGPRICPC